MISFGFQLSRCEQRIDETANLMREIKIGRLRIFLDKIVWFSYCFLSLFFVFTLFVPCAPNAASGPRSLIRLRSLYTFYIVPSFATVQLESFIARSDVKWQVIGMKEKIRRPRLKYLLASFTVLNVCNIYFFNISNMQLTFVDMAVVYRWHKGKQDQTEFGLTSNCRYIISKTKQCVGKSFS